MTDYERGYQQGYADAMNWKTQNHLEHLPGREPISPRPWVGLTDEEINAIPDGEYIDGEYIDFYKAIETKLKEKNGG
jgi:hypothetical protein